MHQFHNGNHHDPHQITPLAITNWRDIRKRFGIKAKNRRGHMYLVGKTGTGKSTLLETMAISDIEQGNGIAFIDPHGDVAEDLLHYVPEHRINEVIYFNPTDLEHPLAFNPIGTVHPDLHHLVTSGLISTFKKIWSEFWGPRLEHILRHAILTLLEYPHSTLLDIPRLLTDKDFRKRVVEQITHLQVKAFWLLEFEKYSAWLKAEATAPILNKVGQFLTNLPLRNIVGQQENTFTMRKVMDEGKILIVNVAKGKIGEDNCALLGSMIVTKIQLAALSRVDILVEQRRPFYLYVDEFQNFLTLSFAEMLSESRKYGLHLILANQYLAQLEEKIRGAIFGNVGSIIAFRVGAEDAEYLSKEFYPDLNELDFVNLPNHQIYLKLMIDGMTSRAFSATTLPLPERTTSFKDQVIEQSRRRYGRSRKEVEREILTRNQETVAKPSSQRSLFS